MTCYVFYGKKAEKSPDSKLKDSNLDYCSSGSPLGLRLETQPNRYLFEIGSSQISDFLCGKEFDGVLHHNRISIEMRFKNIQQFTYFFSKLHKKWWQL